MSKTLRSSRVQLPKNEKLLGGSRTQTTPCLTDSPDSQNVRTKRLAPTPPGNSTVASENSSEISSVASENSGDAKIQSVSKSDDSHIAPPWVKDLQKNIITEMQTKFVHEIKDYIEGKFDELRVSLDTKLSEVVEENDALRIKTNELQQTVHVLSSKVTSMSKDMTQLQKLSMKNNLIIDGIPEEKNETVESLKEKITNLLETDLDLSDAEDVTLISWHRLSKPIGSKRPKAILIKLLRDIDRERILRASIKLKGKTPAVFINPQLPRELEYGRRMMRRVATRARELGHKASARDEKIMINGKIYDLNDVHEAPFNTAEICTSTTDTHVCFYGALSPLSNFHPAKFTHKGITYMCSEQLIQREKALFFDRDDLAIQILLETNPITIKSIGDSLTGNQESWEEEAEDKVFPGLREKFRQNSQLLDYLLATEQRQLMECNPSDRFWSCGTSVRQCDGRANLPGKNILGSLLTRVREDLEK